MTEGQADALWAVAYMRGFDRSQHWEWDKRAHEEARHFADRFLENARRHAPRTGQGPEGGRDGTPADSR